MILRKSALLSVLLSASGANAYFAQVANAHIEFAAGNTDVESNTNNNNTPETTDDRSSLRHSSASLWNALEDALKEKDDDGESAALLGFAAPKIMELFEEWAEKFGREYESLEVKSGRMLVWLENHVLIETHNAKKESSSFTLGHNEFSDLSHDEFKQRMFIESPELINREDKRWNFMEFEEEEEVTNSKLRGPAEASIERKLESTENREDVGKDWHDMGLMGPIRNQGSCGGCWAFSAIGSIESAMGIDKYNKMTPNERTEFASKIADESDSLKYDLGLVVPLSEQNLIDCDTLYEKGCRGGLMTTTFEEEEHKHGICSEIDYPYLQTQGTCSSDLCAPVDGSIVKDHVDITPRKNNALVEALKVKPVTAAMVATDPMFQFYKKGIFTSDIGKVTKEMGGEDCNMLYEGQKVCLPDINHGVLVVGYGKDDTVTNTETKTYFKVKNSWGEAWGEGGYFRLARYEVDKTDPLDNWGECAILTLLSYPVME